MDLERIQLPGSEGLSSAAASSAVISPTSGPWSESAAVVAAAVEWTGAIEAGSACEVELLILFKDRVLFSSVLAELACAAAPLARTTDSQEKACADFSRARNDLLGVVGSPSRIAQAVIAGRAGISDTRDCHGAVIPGWVALTLCSSSAGGHRRMDCDRADMNDPTKAGEKQQLENVAMQIQLALPRQVVAI